MKTLKPKREERHWRPYKASRSSAREKGRKPGEADEGIKTTLSHLSLEPTKAKDSTLDAIENLGDESGESALDLMKEPTLASKCVTLVQGPIFDIKHLNQSSWPSNHIFDNDKGCDNQMMPVFCCWYEKELQPPTSSTCNHVLVDGLERREQDNSSYAIWSPLVKSMPSKLNCLQFRTQRPATTEKMEKAYQAFIEAFPQLGTMLGDRDVALQILPDLTLTQIVLLSSTTALVEEDLDTNWHLESWDVEDRDAFICKFASYKFANMTEQDIQDEWNKLTASLYGKMRSRW